MDGKFAGNLSKEGLPACEVAISSPRETGAGSMRWIGTLAVVAMLCLTGASRAEGNEAGEAAQQYRQSLFQTIVWNFKPMSDMARGKREFDATEAKRRALAVSYLSVLLGEAFPEGSGASAGTTDALDAIWKNQEDFAAKLKNFQVEANALRKIADQGDAASFNDQFKKLSGTCKGCHDKFKAD
jgi:cytochrome c556